MDNYDMKSRKFLRIATFFASAMLAAASHGWGFDSALKSVSGATQKVKEVNDVLQGEPAPAAQPEPAPAAQPAPAPTAQQPLSYQAKVKAVQDGLMTASAKMPLRDHYQEMYNAAYEFSNVDRQYSFLPPEQRAARTSPEKMKLVNQFIEWVADGMKIDEGPSVEETIAANNARIQADCEAAEKRRKAEEDADRAKFEAEEKKRIAAEKAEEAAMRDSQQVDSIKNECLRLYPDYSSLESLYSITENSRMRSVIESFFSPDVSAVSREKEMRKPGLVSTVSLEKAKEYKAGLEKNIEADKTFIAGVEGSTDEAALAKALETDKFSYENTRKIAKRLADTAKDAAILTSLYCGDKENLIDYQYKGNIAARLAEMADGISDTNVVVKLLSSDGVKNVDHRAKLLAILPEADAVAFVKNRLDRHSVDKWNEGHHEAFYDAIAMMKTSKDPNAVVESVMAVLGKIAEYKDICKRNFLLNWGEGDEKAVANILKALPKLDDKKLEEVLCADETVWTYFVDSASEDVAYGVLSAGKAKSADLEVALAKKLPGAKIDQKVYDGTRSDAAKKALVEKMSPAMKKSVAEAAKKAYKNICAKAKDAAKETFELDGFYLGMSFDDAKVVLAQHFPDLTLKDEIDGKGDDADHVIYLPGQKSPFCFASYKDKKVYQFNFGKKLLRKWYDFDVQTYIEWAAKYGRKTKSDMRFELLEKDTTVYEDDMSRSYKVWFHQEAYRYKNNKKGYRATYFGEEREFTIEGGIGGELIKARAASDFRYFRGDPGSLRIQVMKD